MYRLPRILWGGSGVLDFPYPFDNPRSYSQPREGSAFFVLANGESDSWASEDDHLLEVDARWIERTGGGLGEAHTPWIGAAGVQAFLDWASLGGAFGLVHDRVAAPFVATTCWLEAAEVGQESDGTRRVALTLRSAAPMVGY